MDKQPSELIEKIRQQFNSAPYPHVPIEYSPKYAANVLFIHNLLTPYYLKNQRYLDTKNKLILDAACGNGFTTLILAEANPGAKIIGIDISEVSIKIAKERLQYHGFTNVEFHVLPIEELPQQGWKFDYINCDEVLYLLPDPASGLRIFKSVLHPEGIIRANLHCATQRFDYYRAQKLFKIMGLMDDNPEELEISIVTETMQALKDTVNLKSLTWHPQPDKEDEKHRILMNYLFQGDKGYTIPEMFSFLQSANLEFISMVNWRDWELMDLFQQPDKLPNSLTQILSKFSVAERLYIFELLEPNHRLLDFWCGHPQPQTGFKPASEWTMGEWLSARVHLHPQLHTPHVKADLINCIQQQKAFNITQHLPTFTNSNLEINSYLAACLLPLWEGSQPFSALVKRWLQIRPVHPLSLEVINDTVASEQVQNLLIKLEALLCVLFEQKT